MLTSKSSKAAPVRPQLSTLPNVRRQVLLRNPDHLFAHINPANTYMMKGQTKEARAEAAEVIRINPKFTLDNHAKAMAGYHPDQSSLDRHIGNLRKAGLK